MKHSLKAAASVLANGRRRAYISRVAWLELEQFITTAFNEIIDNIDEIDELGSLHFTTNRQYQPFNGPNFNVFNITNQILIRVGSRLLNVSHAINIDGKPCAELLDESGATLSLSQDATGSVIVFISPYKSEAMSMDEENIILDRHSCASSISKKDIRRYLSKFLRYCAVTSVHGDLGWGGYSYRLWLKYNDFRNASQMRANAFNYIKLFSFPIIVLVTLYAGGKILT